jgi:hypothetical protein
MTITSERHLTVLAETTEAGRHSPKFARSDTRHAAVELSKERSVAEMRIMISTLADLSAGASIVDLCEPEKSPRVPTTGDTPRHSTTPSFGSHRT